MILYVTVITIAGLLIAGVVSLVSGAGFFLTLGFTALAIVVVVLLDGLTATVCRLLPAGIANHEKKFYHVSPKEKKFYEKLGIRKWKDKIPEIGHFTGFRKNKIADPKSVEYLDRFLLEICYGELGHFLSIFTGAVTLLFFPLTRLWWAISIPVVLINAFMNLPSLFILRYNSYKLKFLRDSTLKKQARAKKNETENSEKETNL